LANFGRRARHSDPSKLKGASGQPAHSLLTYALLVIIGLGAFLFSPARQLYADTVTPIPRDLAPGRQFTVTDYATPMGCPPRVWAVGEYLPLACILHHRIDHASGEAVGLETPLFVGKLSGRRSWWGFRQREWVRVGADAVLVTRPKNASGRILYLARNRFEAEHSTHPNPRLSQTFRNPPMDYLLSASVDLLFVPGLVLIFVGGTFLLLRLRPDLFKADS
jgi:hypothetical protein